MSFEPSPLFVTSNAARDADVLHVRHEDQIPSWQGHVRRHSRAFRSDRPFRDLHHQFLPFGEQLFDGFAAFPFGTHFVRILIVVIRIQQRIIGFRIQGQVRDMHERRLFQADVHKGRLHAGQHLGHLALINVADKIFVLGAVAEKIRDHAVIQHRNTSFFPCDGYRNFHTHTNSFRSAKPFEPT